MAKTPEVKVKEPIYEILDSAGAYYLQPVTGGYGNSFHPDIVACVQGVFFGIEAKAGKNKATEGQKKKLRECLDAGGVACVINETNLDELDHLIELIFDRGPGGILRRARHLRTILPKGHTLEDAVPDIRTTDE